MSLGFLKYQRWRSSRPPPLCFTCHCSHTCCLETWNHNKQNTVLHLFEKQSCYYYVGLCFMPGLWWIYSIFLLIWFRLEVQYLHYSPAVRSNIQQRTVFHQNSVLVLSFIHTKFPDDVQEFLFAFKVKQLFFTDTVIVTQVKPPVVESNWSRLLISVFTAVFKSYFSSTTCQKKNIGLFVPLTINYSQFLVTGQFADENSFEE